MLQKEKNKIGELLIRLREGDEDAFEEFVSQTLPVMKNISFSILGNREDAEDAVQESYLAIIKYVDHFRYNKSGYCWVIRIVQNKSLEMLRKKKRRREIDCDTMPEIVFYQEMDDDILTRQLLSQLSSFELKVVTLRYYGDLSLRQLAKAIGRPLSSTHRLLRKIEFKMRRLIRY